ncbi:MAG: hypothetical protein IRY97_02055 [Thermomicrobiaceae bacterium]|nr:hypothetical protein [Thermomicrobiaceae bacterium]
MSGTLPETLSAILQSIEENVGLAESRLADSVEQLRVLLEALERERSSVQGQLEERKIDRVLGIERAASDGGDGAKGTGELRQYEDVLSADYARVSALFRQLHDFVQFLRASRQQFHAGGDLPGVDDAQRFAIRQAMVRAQEDERRRLAREVHDGPAQVLANAIIGLEFVERALRVTIGADAAGAIEEIDRVKVAMREGLTEIRRFIFDLRPTMLSQRGLAGTVEHYIETYRHLFPGEVELSMPPTLPRLSPDQELTAFRVIQESLQNVYRHAHSTKTWVSLAVTEDGLVVRVRDNGQGFRTTAVAPTSSGGFGLAGMRERAEVIGARLTITSAPGEGTDVMLVIPLDNQALDQTHHRPVGRAGALRRSG